LAEPAFKFSVMVISNIERIVGFGPSVELALFNVFTCAGLPDAGVIGRRRPRQPVWSDSTLAHPAVPKAHFVDVSINRLAPLG